MNTAVNHTSRRLMTLALTAAAAAVILAPGFAHAQADKFPARPIKLVVAAPAGTPVDIIARLLAQKMGEDLKQAVVIDNKPGATGAIGAQAVLQAPADGYTLMTAFMPMTIAPAIYAKVPYDLKNDFTAIGQTTWSYNVLVVPPALNVGSTKELVDLLKSKPGQLSYASGGYGTPAHILAVLFEAQSQTKAIHVAYPGGQAATNLMGGQHAYMFLAVPSAVGAIQGGQLKALAVAADHRLANLPGVPTVAEQGFPMLDVRDWQGIVVRHGTPADVVARLNTALAKALADQQVRDTMVTLGAEAAPGTAEDFSALIRKEMTRWAGVAKAANLQVQ